MAEEKTMNGEKEFNFEEWVERKQARRAALYSKVDEMAYKALSDKEVLSNYLTVQAKLGTALSVVGCIGVSAMVHGYRSCLFHRMSNVERLLTILFVLSGF